MKKVKNQAKSISIVLITLLLFQSCRVYKRTPVTIEQAIAEEKRVKVKMKNKDVYKFKRLAKEGETYYGVKRRKGKIVRIPLIQEEIAYIKLHDKTWSVVFGIITGVVVTYGIAIALILIAWNGPYIGAINFTY